MSVRTRIGALIALIAVAIASLSAMSASADRPQAQATPKKVVGSWMVTANRGPTLPPVRSLQTYTRGRGVVENGNLGAARGPSHGAWRYLGNRRYGTTMVFFRYDPGSGAFLGTTKLRHELEVARDGQSFTGVSVPEFRDPDGNLQPGSNVRRDAVTGQRINVEPLPVAP